MKRILNKWQIVFKIYRDFWLKERPIRIMFGIFKITKFPPDGERLWNKYYKGFLWDSRNIVSKIKIKKL